MKKVLSFAVLAVILFAMPVSAEEDRDEENKRQMAITLSPNPLIIGLFLGGFGINAGFEFAPVSTAAVKANVFYIGFDPVKLIGLNDDNLKSLAYMLRVNMEARWYPMAQYVKGFFVNGGVQYHRLSLSAGVSFDTDEEKESAGGGLNSISICSGLGYKVVIGKEQAGFVIEPNMEFAWDVYSDIPFQNMVPPVSYFLGNVLGIRGFRFNLLFGAAF